MTESEKNKLFAALKEKYNPEGSKLRKYQLHLLETLKEFDTFCREHGIIYYLAYGTLLGAVRHKGFIPWDDDADIWMDRENYAKLEKLMQEEYHRLTENVYVNHGIRPTLWAAPFADIDVFIIGDSPNNVILRKIKEMIVIFLYVMVKCRGRIDLRHFGKFKLYFLLFPFAYLHKKDTWLKRFENAQKLFSQKGNVVQMYNSVPSDIMRKYPAEKEIWEPIELEFEGYRFYAPKGWDKLLTLRYGDYMKIPNSDELQVHGTVDKIEVKE